MMWFLTGALVIGITFLGGGSCLAGESTLQTQTRGIFNQPNSGEAVGSVWGVFVGVSKYLNKDLNLEYAIKMP